MKDDVKDMATMMVGVVSRLSMVQRYNTALRVRSESVSEHIFCVMFFAYVFHAFLEQHGVQSNLEKLLSITLVHDVDEAFTGDVVYTVKHQSAVPELKEALDRVSSIAMSDIFSRSAVDGLEERLMDLWKEAKALDTVEAKIFKLSDVASILYQSNVQELMGNRHFTAIRKRAEKRFKDLVDEFEFPAILTRFPDVIREAELECAF